MQLDSHTLRTLAFQSLNLAVFVGIIYRAAKPSFVGFVAQRSVTLREQIIEAKKRLETSQQQYAEYRARLESMGAEVAALRAQNAQDIAAVSSRIKEESSRQAQRIVSEARLARDASISASKARLARELGRLVLARAELMIKDKLTGDQKAKIRRDFSNQLEQIQ